MSVAINSPFRDCICSQTKKSGMWTKEKTESVQTKNSTHVHLMFVYMCDVHTVDLKIFGVKIFLSFALVTKIKNTKIYIPNT